MYLLQIAAGYYKIIETIPGFETTSQYCRQT